MTTWVRDSEFDVGVVAGPGLDIWPSEGIKLLTSTLADFGLKVGAFGGDTLIARGILPSETTGAWIILEDLQHRIHRVKARAVVRVTENTTMPDPFEGWVSGGLVPLSAAERLLALGTLSWEPGAALLGTGNATLRFGTRLLEKGIREIVAIESLGHWKNKKYSGWEVERRRFEMMGGRILFGSPLSLKQKTPHVWTLRVQLEDGVRVLDVFKVVSGGPFGPSSGVREFPSQSLLYELIQSAPKTEEEDPEGFHKELNRCRGLAVDLIRSLQGDLGEKKAGLERLTRAKKNQKAEDFHQERHHQFEYEAKWLTADQKNVLRDFEGIPRETAQLGLKASIECFEEITCETCQKVCPEVAISLEDRSKSLLSEKDCTGCGICVAACPSQAISLVQEGDVHGKSTLVIPWKGKDPFSVGHTAQLLNRKGDFLAAARVSEVQSIEGYSQVQLVKLHVPSHFVWDARMVRFPRGENPEDPKYALQQLRASVDKVEVFIDGKKRLARPKIPVALALHELGSERPEDKNLCMDGSCGLCAVWVDGVKRLGCKESVRRGMSIRLKERFDPQIEGLCPCQGLQAADIESQIKNSNFHTADAVAEATGVCEGKCVGQMCREPFRRLLERNGISAQNWIDWRFPFSEWSLFPLRD